MKRLALKPMTVLAAFFAAVSLLLAGLAARSADTTDAFMFAGPGDRCLLVVSHEGRWVEITWLEGWPDRGVRWWSATRGRLKPMANSWNEAGPF
jgi:hypothetical protein